MAGLPKVKRILKEDLKDAPNWIDRMLYPINLFFDSVYIALNKNITFGDNIKAQVKQFEITGGATADLNTTSFSLSISSPMGLLLLSCIEQSDNYTSITNAVTIPSWRVNGTNLLIDSITGLTSGTTYTITVLVI